VLDLDYLATEGFIDLADQELVHLTDSGREAAEFVLARCGCDKPPPT
jgi:Mn-dependent DtxR family transcriptional regulator